MPRPASFRVIHDHRCFELSGGWPRQDIDPWRQILDWAPFHHLPRQTCPESECIRVFGSSYAGGHALVLAGSYRRIKVIVAQAPTISGFEQGKRRKPNPPRPATSEPLNADERAQMRGSEPVRPLLNVSTADRQLLRAVDCQRQV